MSHRVHFGDGTGFDASLASNKKEALAHGWIVVLNALMYNQMQQFKGKSFTAYSKMVTVEKIKE